MRAVETGKISLDDGVSKRLPAFADRPQIKIRHLAAHVKDSEPSRARPSVRRKRALCRPTPTFL